jgi:LPXTG-motif cell wall-anchored protein
MRRLFAALLTLALVALHGAPAAFAQGSLPADVTGSGWELVSLTPAGGAAEDTTGGGITLEFGEGNAVNGSGGCNNYRSAYTSSGAGQVTFEQAASTLRACDGPAGTREPVFFEALTAVDSYSLSGDRLTMTGAGGVELVFARAAAPAAGGTVGGTAPSTLPSTGGESAAALWLALAAAALGGAGLVMRRRAAR